ncbi:MAG: hypothetical protein LUE93_12465, partial [Bacteroides sp.]|nr:hypothetical protein [Bacteroides sp.]
LMKKRYDLPEEEDNFEKNMVNEPAASAYGMEIEMETLPALTEEELAECMSSDEFWEDISEYVDELYTKK